MRYVAPKPAPWGWRTHVLKKGRDWLNEGNGRNRSAVRPASFWLAYRNQLGEAFDYICAYTAVYVPNGQADHFIPWDAVKGTPRAELAYQWSNIRYCDGWVNQSKGKDAFPDPFVVQDDWFELHLPSLELRATGTHPPHQDAAIKNLLKRVARDERVMKTRRRYFEQYREGIRSLELVDREAPILGMALRANPKYLTPDDRARLHSKAP